MEDSLLQGFMDKSLTSEELVKEVGDNWDLLPTVIAGVSSSKAAIRYGCAKVLMDLSEKHPDKLYPYMDFCVDLLDSKYRILTWNALAIIANLTKVDDKKKFDKIFSRYYSLLDDEYMVTVANVVGNSGKIALVKPYLTERISNELLKVENISTGLHLTEECKRVIAEHAIQSFSIFFDQVKNKEKIIQFVKKYTNSQRKTLKKEAENFLKKWTS
ncbi:MAG: hypothetical protein QG670_780 [Thermoproteota archaeon]|nr:hypothetical protein [Thermoproteota archaeon]